MTVPNEKLPTKCHYPYLDKGFVLRGIKMFMFTDNLLQECLLEFYIEVRAGLKHVSDKARPYSLFPIPLLRLTLQQWF
jgi:hypothetical protein